MYYAAAAVGIVLALVALRHWYKCRRRARTQYAAFEQYFSDLNKNRWDL